MASQFIDLNAPSLQGKQPKLPSELPHGLITPPEEVLAIVAREKAKFPAEIFTPEAEQRIMNDLTLQYYCDYLGFEVLYRETAQGPEVLAVDFAEILPLTRVMTLEERSKLKTWLP